MRLLAVFLALVASLALPAAAQAHATLVRTVPSDRAALQQSPKRVLVIFDDTVDVGRGNAAVDANGNSILGGRPRTSGKTLTLPLRSALAKGDYTVRWSIVSDDGHELRGLLTFSVGTGRPPAAAVLSTGGGLTFYDVLARLLAFAGLLAAVGIAFFDLWSWRPVARRALPTGLLAIACALVFVGAHGMTHATHASGWNRFSFVWESAGVWAAVAATLAAIGIADERVRPVAAPFALPLVVAPTLAGHALDPGRSWIDVPIDLLHVAAAAVWLGGLVALVAVMPRTSEEAETRAARRFSSLALVSVVVIALTGVGRALAELSAVSQLWTTGYGRALTVKTLLLLVLVALGRLSRERLRAGVARVWATARAELVPALGLAVAIAFLTALPPGRTPSRAAAQNTIAATGTPPLPPPDATLAARRDGVLDALLWVRDGRATVTYYGLGVAARVEGVRIDGKGTRPCGPGCYTAEVGGAPTSVTVTHGGSRVAFDLTNRGNATQLVKRAAKVFHDLGAISFVERLSSGTAGIQSTWHQVAPNRLTYSIRGGAQAVIIGAKRWDRPPGGAWMKSAQEPLSLPAPPWNAARVANARIVERTPDKLVVAFFDPQGGPAWYLLTIGAKTLRPQKMEMIAPAHFMHHRYFGLGKPKRIVPPS